MSRVPIALLLLTFAATACESGVEPASGPLAPQSPEQKVLVDGTDQVCYDLLAGQAQDAGDACFRVVDDVLEIEYATHVGWVIDETHAWVGMNLSTLPLTPSGNPKPGQFPYGQNDLGGTSSWSMSIPLTDFGIEDPEACNPKTLYLSLHAAVRLEGVDGYTHESAWAEGNRINEEGNWATYNRFELTCEPDVCTQTLLYATENNHPTIGQYAMEARIWQIDATTGNAAMVGDQSAPVNGAEATAQGTATTDNFNGNAWSEDSGRFYFSDYQRLGPAGGNPLPSPLYFNDLAGTQAYAGLLVGAAASGAFHQETYYYISQRTDDLRAVTFLLDGTVDEDVHVADLLDNTDALGFGDIAIGQDGTAYLSATTISDFTVLFGTFELDGTGFSIIETGSLYGAGGTQIAFGSDGVLYGVNARTPFELFKIDPATGNTTFVAELPEAFSDLAKGPCAY